jgi:hypothetical protein
MKRISCLLTAAVCSLVLCGCGTTSKFIYPSNVNNLAQIAEAPVYDKKVAVVPFVDYRGDTNDMSTIFLYLIPLWPYGYCEYQRPEASSGFMTVGYFDFTADEDLAKAAALSLRRSNLFKDAFFTFGGDKDRADFVFHGDIYSTTYKAGVYSYGLSMAGPYLWLLGLPAGTSTNQLKIKFYMTRKNSRDIIWQYSFEDEKEITQGIYYRVGEDVKMYVPLLEKALNAAIIDLYKQIQVNPALLK